MLMIFADKLEAGFWNVILDRVHVSFYKAEQSKAKLHSYKSIEVSGLRRK